MTDAESTGEDPHPLLDRPEPDYLAWLFWFAYVLAFLWFVIQYAP